MYNGIFYIYTSLSGSLLINILYGGFMSASAIGLMAKGVTRRSKAVLGRAIKRRLGGGRTLVARASFKNRTLSSIRPKPRAPKLGFKPHQVPDPKFNNTFDVIRSPSSSNILPGALKKTNNVPFGPQNIARGKTPLKSAAGPKPTMGPSPHPTGPVNKLAQPPTFEIQNKIPKKGKVKAPMSTKRLASETVGIVAAPFAVGGAAIPYSAWKYRH